MRKIFLSLLFVFSFLSTFSQTKIIRTTAANTVYDTRHGAILNEILPVYYDTAHANVTANIGLDSCAAIIYTRSDNKMWIRRCPPGPKYWVSYSTGGGGGGTVTGGINGVSLDGSNIVLGGSLDRDTEIYGGHNFGLTLDSLTNFSAYANSSVDFAVSDGTTINSFSLAAGVGSFFNSGNISGNKISIIGTLPDSILINAHNGQINIDSLRNGFIDTVKYKPMAWSPTTGDWVAMNSWAQVGVGLISGRPNNIAYYDASTGAISPGIGELSFRASTNVLSNTMGMVRIWYRDASMLGPEALLHMSGNDIGNMYSRIYNAYAGPSNGSAISYQLIDSMSGKVAQLYFGHSTNVFTGNAIMLHTNSDFLKLHSEAGPIDLAVGTLNVPGVNTIVRVTTAARVGIGTLTPGQKLSVIGSFSTSDSTIFRGLTTGSSSDSVLVTSGGLTKRVLQSSISGVNIYNSDGTLSGDRTVNLLTSDLDIVGSNTEFFMDELNSRIFMSSSGGIQLVSSFLSISNPPTSNDTTTRKILVYNTSTNRVEKANWSNSGSGGSSAISALTAATAGNSILNSTFAQVWDWDQLRTGNALTIAGSLTASTTTGDIKLLNLTANDIVVQDGHTFYGVFSDVTTAGGVGPTTSRNIAIYASAANSIVNHAIFVNAGTVNLNPLTATTILGLNASKNIVSAALSGLTWDGTTLTVTASSGITIGTTAITSGTTGRFLYDNAGVVGESIIGYGLSGTSTLVADTTILVNKANTQIIVGAKTFTGNTTWSSPNNSFRGTFSIDNSGNAIYDYNVDPIFRRGGGNIWTYGASNFTIVSGVGLVVDANTLFVHATNNGVGFGMATPAARIEIAAGTATAGTAPIKLTTGTSLTVAVAGVMEYTTPQLFFTNGGLQRQEIPQIQQSRVSTQYDNTTTTLGNVTGLTATVVASRIYRFEATLFTTSNVSGGIKVAIGGTATATAVVYEGLTTDAGLTTQGRATALGTAVGGVTAVTASVVKIYGTITVNAAGTLTCQAAANAATGTTSVLAGSTFVLTEMP